MEFIFGTEINTKNMKVIAINGSPRLIIGNENLCRKD